MKILFTGLGSIASKHIQIILKNYRHKIYALHSNSKKYQKIDGVENIFSYQEAERLKPEVVFITNPTSLHIKTALKFTLLNCHLFIEKPVSNSEKGLSQLISEIKTRNLTAYVAYQLRFHPVINALKKYISKQIPLHLRAVCTSHLALWRPGTDYKKNYSANSKMGGGVILDLSHETDYVNFLLGDIIAINGVSLNSGSLGIDAEDIADLSIQTKTCLANIHLSYMSNLAQRYIQLEFGNKTIIGDILNHEILEYKKQKLVKKMKLNYKKHQEYEAQIAYFFKNLNNPHLMNNLESASSLFKKIIAFKK